MKKSGITMMVVVLAVSVILVVISSASVIGYNSINTANFEEYKSRIDRANRQVDYYYLKNEKLPTTNEEVAVDSLNDEFIEQLISKNDYVNKLYVVDISKLNDNTIKIGNGNLSNKDILLVSENSNNIYYLKGFKYKEKIYYTN